MCFTCSKVLNFKHPHELMESIDLSVPEGGQDDDTIIQLCRQVANHSVKTGKQHKQKIYFLQNVGLFSFFN